MILQRKTLRRILIGLAVLILGCGIVGYIGLSGLSDMFGGCDASEPAEIEKIARFKLPPSAQNLSSSCGGMQGWFAQARFEMNPVDLDRFVASTGVKTPLSATEKPTELLTTLFKDYMGSVTTYLYGKYEVSEFFQEVFIDTTDPTKYVVYVNVLGG